MDLPEIILEVASRSEASEILDSPRLCAEVTCLISIGEPHDQLPAGYDNISRKLRLLFADTVQVEGGPTEDDVRQIIEFAESLRMTPARVLIHCEAGISRSSAAALIIYACLLGPGRERDAMERVMAQRPIAQPNRRMVELADRLLGRGGSLAKVIG
jgi:predicted protein tyrosine phosphatase